MERPEEGAGPWGPVATLLLTCGAWLVASGAQHLLDRLLPLEPGHLWAVSLCVGGSVETAWVCLWVRLRAGVGWGAYLALRRVAWRTTVWWVGGALLFAAGADGLTGWMSRPIVPEVMREAYATAGWLPLFWLALVLVAPLAEEVVFRGFLYRGLEELPGGTWVAIGGSALFWTATHAQYEWFSLGIVFSAGLFLGVARWRTGSVLVTTLLHMILNTIAVAEAAWAAHQG